MAAVGVASHSSLIQEPSGSEISRETGKIATSSIHELFTQTSAEDALEARSCSTRFLDAFLGMIRRVCSCIKATPAFTIETPAFTTETPASSIETPASTKKTFRKKLECSMILIKDPNLTVEERLSGFYDLLEVLSNFLGASSAERAVCVETQVQTACNELPSWIQQELCRCLAVSDIGRLKADSYPNLLEIRKILRKVEKDLPSVKLARLHRLFDNRITHQGRVSHLLSIIEVQYKLSKLDPHITVEALKKYVLYLFNTFDESVKEGIYTAVRNVVLEEKSSSVEINGSLVSIQNESLGELIVNADPLGRRVQLGMKQWRG